MDNYAFFDQWYDDFLEHSGVKGMKHGVRNYQYPDGTWTELGKERRRVGDGRYTSITSSPKGTKEIKFQKNVRFAESIYDDVYEVNKSSILDDVNLKHNPFRQNNCGYCSVAYDLRRRGNAKARAKMAYKMLDIKAIEKLYGREFKGPDSTYMGSGLTMMGAQILNKLRSEIYFSANAIGIKTDKDEQKEKNAIKALTDIRNTSFTKPEIKRIESEIESQGDGARGIMSVDWKGTNSGHYFNYENANGKTYLIDAQNRIIADGLSSYLRYGCRVHYIRTDDVSINENALNDIKRIKHSDEEEVVYEG